MKLVLLFFCAIFGLIIFLTIMLTLSTFKLNVSKLNISNIKNGFKKDKLEKEIQIYLELFLFGKIKIAKINLSKKSMISKIKPNIKKLKLKNSSKKLKNINFVKIIKMLKIKVDKANLEAQIGTEDIMTTVFATTLLSSLSRNTV